MWSDTPGKSRNKAALGHQSGLFRVEPIAAANVIATLPGRLVDDAGLRATFEAAAADPALCRGEVTGEDWRRPELRERYGDHWVPALLRLIERHRSNSPPLEGCQPLR